MTDKENGKLDKIVLEIEQLKKLMYRVETTMQLHTDEIIEFNVFKKDFRKENGWVPKIIDGIRDNFRHDIKILKDEIMAKFDSLPCFDLKFDDTGLLQSRCRIANSKDPLLPDEKVMK